MGMAAMQIAGFDALKRLKAAVSGSWLAGLLGGKHCATAPATYVILKCRRNLLVHCARGSECSWFQGVLVHCSWSTAGCQLIYIWLYGRHQPVTVCVDCETATINACADLDVATAHTSAHVSTGSDLFALVPHSSNRDCSSVF